MNLTKIEQFYSAWQIRNAKVSMKSYRHFELLNKWEKLDLVECSGNLEGQNIFFEDLTVSDVKPMYSGSLTSPIYPV